MSEALSGTPTRSFRARTGERVFDVALAGTTVRIDDRPTEAAFDHVGGDAYVLRLDGRSVPATIEPLPGGRLRVTAGGRSFDVQVQDEQDLLRERFGVAAGAATGVREVRAPMPGLVRSVAVAPGQTVAAGATLLVLEAMKMENELRAEAGGVVQSVHVTPGEAVGKNTLLIEFEA